jgi:hypothetical protein|tara:strand:- start:141 stop:404 length:264 start_codon:yes stop_codon:yes gene_type:complete
MKIKNYIAWCEDNGHVNEYGEADSMEYANEYMKGKAYAKENDKHSLMDTLEHVGMRVFDDAGIQYMLDNGITPDMIGLGEPRIKDIK